MAKSMRSKMKRRLRTLRREIAQPFYEKKDEAKLAAQEAALAAPKVVVRNQNDNDDMTTEATAPTSMDVEMADGGKSNSFSLKPVSGVGKKWKKSKQKGKRRGKGKGKRKHD